VRHVQIGPEGALALADALKVNPVLSSLDMSNTRIGEHRVWHMQCTVLELQALHV
jgi:hypothetical protein